MAYKRKSWTDKMNSGKNAVVEVLDKKFADIPQGAKMLIATPEIIKNYLQQIPQGYSVSITQMRKDLAAEYNAEATCPLTAGIFLRIVAEASWEELQSGASEADVAPFWRMIDSKSPMAKKLSFGMDFINKQRAAEGLPL